MDFTLEGLRVCREVALRGSFTAAAQALGYSQPAVSRQVAAMESAAGYRLFDRELRGVSVTPAGTLLVEHAARVLGGVAALEHELRALGDRLAGRVNVGAFPAAMSVLVPRAVARLSVEHPGLAVKLTEAATPTLLRDLRAGRLQVAVVGVGSGLPDYDLDGLGGHRIDAGNLCVAVPEGHRLAAVPTVAVRELADEPWITGTGSAGDPQFGAWPTLPEPLIRYRVRSWPARLGLVAAGLGLCLLPALAARSVPAGVVCVDVDDPAWTGRRALALTVPEPPDAALAVVAALRAAADGMGQKTPIGKDN
ncbi:LysR family transcriptional regulator [Mycobacterium sp. NAZ190054]|uniref:LysR family transcriptional regulator n=1 Tax=Mycobacterium sp. NAZ190054 TaxID=1747766 RepID=UPI0007967CDF|nr:LysR family transcriptional regulator [Mycobacterium sp. NAZ190054]KWX68178.1 LysR family transcriptional regulator [Mycobacterium sp. NAZ190054]